MKQRFKAPVVALTEEGTCVVASVTEPYFCFEAATEEEAIGLARRALDFWAGTRGRALPSRSRQKSVTTLRPVRRADELVLA